MSNDTRRPVDDWAKEKATSSVLFTLAKFNERWPQGRTLTEAEYDAAIERAASIRFK